MSKPIFPELRSSVNRKVLRALWVKSPLSVKEIAKETNLVEQAVSRALSQLSKRVFIKSDYERGETGKGVKKMNRPSMCFFYIDLAARFGKKITDEEMDAIDSLFIETEIKDRVGKAMSYFLGCPDHGGVMVIAKVLTEDINEYYKKPEMKEKMETVYKIQERILPKRPF